MTEQAKLSLDPNQNLNVAHVVYVELDALLDTRLGTLHGINPQYAIDVFRNPGYYTRVSDDFSAFCGVTKSEYDTAYAKRDVQTLKDSILTGACLLLNEICAKLEQQRLETPFVESVTVEVNLWPYQLDDESRFWIENAVASHLSVDVRVRSTFLAPHEVTLAHVKSVYTGMLQYNFGEWLALHCREFERVRIPGVTVIAPKLHKEGHVAFTSKDLGEGLEHLDPYEAIELLHAPLIGLEWEAIEVFCIVNSSILNRSQIERDIYPQEGP